MGKIYFITGAPGSGKSTKLIQKIQEKVQEGKEVVTIVPEQFSYEFDQKVYKELGTKDFNALQTESFHSIARHLFEKFGNPYEMENLNLRNADDMEKVILMQRAVAEATPHLTVYKKQSRKVDFSDQLQSFFSKLRRNGYGPIEFQEEFCEKFDGRLQEKTKDLFEIYYRYDQLLTKYERKDSETELSEAACLANAQEYYSGKTIFVDEFDSFTTDEYEILEVLLADAEEIYFALRTVPDNMQEFSVFAEVNETIAKIKSLAKKIGNIEVEEEPCKELVRYQTEDLKHINQHIFRDTRIAEKIAPEHIHIAEAPMPVEEVDYVAAEIRRLLTDSKRNLQCKDIAIISNDMETYCGILETALERYELPYQINQKSNMLYTPFLMYIATLLQLIAMRHWDTELLLRLAKTGLTNCSEMEITEIEDYCYKWSIDGKSWDTPFVANDSREEAKVEKIQEIQGKLIQPLCTLKSNLEQATSGAEMCEILYTFIEEKEGITTKLEKMIRIAEKQGMTEAMEVQEDWKQIWKIFLDILDHIARLYEDTEISLEDYSFLLASMVRNIQRALPPRSLNKIMVSPGRIAILNHPKVVFLVGVQEGSFPSGATGDFFFNDRDCMELERAECSIIKSRVSMLAEARLAAYKMMTAASEEVYFTYSKVNISQEKQYPSEVIGNLLSMFPDLTIEQTDTKKSSFYATTYNSAYYHYVRDYQKHDRDIETIQAILQEHPKYRERLENLNLYINQYTNRNAKDPLFQVKDKNLMSEYLGSTLHVSATGLKSYIQCPFQYFCDSVLRLYVREKKKMVGSGTGNLVHYCLSVLLNPENVERFKQMTEEELQQAIEALASNYWEENFGGSFSKTDREIAVYNRAKQGMLIFAQHLQRELNQSKFEPIFTEVEIGKGEIFPEFDLPTLENHTVSLYGFVDRVDYCEEATDKWVRVIDYKTGKKDFDVEHLQEGEDLQMLLYLFAITAGNARLADAEPAGVLYLYAGEMQYTDRDDVGKKSMDNLIDTTYKMSGVVLEDAHVIQLMEQEQKGVYIPASVGKPKRKGEEAPIKGNAIPQMQMRNIRILLHNTLCHMTDKLYNGEIDAQPFQAKKSDQDKKSKSCKYCDYKYICGNFDNHHVHMPTEIDTTVDTEGRSIFGTYPEQGEA